MANTTPTLINYFSRDFTQLRTDLINYVKNYHADKFQYFNDASTDMMYLELLAYVGDVKSYELDKAFNEAFRGTAQARESMIRIAQDLGFYSFNPRPASTQISVSIDVPPIPNDDGSAMVPDPRYLVGIYSGMKVESSNGSTFECVEEINFASGDRRTIIPNFDSNNQLVNFTVTKAVVVIAGETKVQRYYVSASNVKPFLDVLIDDDQVTEIVGVLAVAGNTYDVPDDEDFRNLDKTYVQVENLAQDKIFIDINPIPNEIQSIVNAYTDMTINYGEWVNKPKRFILRRDKDNKARIIFGSTLVDYSYWNQLIGTTDVSKITNFSLNQVLNNVALGEIPSIDSTIFIKFRTGAGTSTNALSNEITDIIDKQFFSFTQTSDFSILDKVRNSLRVSSNLPAIGGANAMTNEEIRESVGKVFSANDRAVTYEDVKTLLYNMPSKYGRPFRTSYEEIKPKVLNYYQIKNYVESQLADLLTLSSYYERENKVSEINKFLSDLPVTPVSIDQMSAPVSIGVSSDGILNYTKSLWLGEKCRLYLLGIDQDYLPTTLYKDANGVWRSKNDLLKLNIKNFLKEKRIIGDWIDIVDAKVVNFQIEFKIMADKKNKQKVLIDCLTRLRDYFDVHNWQINQPIFISNVYAILQEIDGVINVVDIKFYNIFGKDIESNKDYMPVEIGRYHNNTNVSYNNQNNKYLMGTVNNVILSKPDTFLHCRFPESDIKGYLV